MAKRAGIDVRLTRVLLEIGTMCSQLERFEDAEQILGACKAWRDDLPHPSTALALSYFAQRRFAEAEHELCETLAVYPNHQLAKAFLGISRRELDQLHWRTPLKEVIADGRDEWAIRLARSALDLDHRATSTQRSVAAVGRPAPRRSVLPGGYA